MIMNYYIITETNWAKLRDEILSLAECCRKAFGEKSKHTDWLHNGDMCRLLNISKRTLQHYRDTSVLEKPLYFNPLGKQDLLTLAKRVKVE